MNRSSRKTHDLRRRHVRLRQKVEGAVGRPRLAVFRSLRHIYAQLIDDGRPEGGVTLASASTQDPDFPEGQYGGNVAAARTVGRLIAQRARAAGIQAVVFDRGGRRYHGRVKALADAAREGGLQF